MQENIEIHIGREIRNQLAIQKRSVAWLAEQLYCDASSFRRQLKKSYISTDLLYRISTILNMDFFVFYSRQLGKEIQSKQNLPEKQAVFTPTFND
jgi:hypothetical protein